MGVTENSSHPMDVLSSATWKSTIEGEIKARKAWKAKYGHQFEMEDPAAPTPAASRPATGAQRPATGRSQASCVSRASQRSTGSHAERTKLLELKKKLTAALSEVEDELS